MKKEELVQKTDLAISELVYDKEDLRKAYNYYNCKRDEEQFKYLEDNYGIGQPTSVEFIPLIKKHVDYLIGEYLDIPIKPKVSCKDSATINNIFREKQLKIAEECSKFLTQHLKNSLLRVLGKKDIIDINIKEQLDKIVEDIDTNFISEYEIAGQNIIEYLIQSRSVDLINKLRQLYVDLLVTGYTFYRVIPEKNNIVIECLSPLDTFPELDYNTPYIKDSKRVVVRKYLTRNQILNKYGKDLSKDDLNNIKNEWRDYLETSNSYFVRSVTGADGVPATDGIRAGEEVSPTYPESNWFRYKNDLIPVYEVEWIETDKDFVMQRYSTARIGDDIYILRGKQEDVFRSIDDPSKCSLSVNGIYFSNRTSKPFSMVQACMVLQDKYDLLHFYRDSLIASSGTVGDFINLPTLPAILGDNLAERLLKWKAYSKQGIKLLDTSQEGQINTGQAPINTMFNGFDDTVKVQAIQAIQIAIDSIEQTVSSITGVFRERLNGIQQRDAVTNIKVGINNSFTVTRQWLFQMDIVLQEILLDSLNNARLAYKEGITGTLILGDKLQKVFTALPQYYTVTDFDIHIITSSDIMKEIEQIKGTIPDFIKGGIVPPDIIIEIMSAKSLSELKTIVNKAIKKQKAENNQLQQLSQQNEQLQQNLQQMQQQLQQAQRKIESLNETKMQLEQQRLKLENDVEIYKAQTDRTFKESKAENDTKRTEIELRQLYDGNPYNDQIRDV